jgi:lipopolysaccharide export system permease protein
MQFLWKYLDELVGKGLNTSVIVELMFYAAMNLVPMAFPLSVLMASVMTFGNLGERFELMAIKASGVSLLKIMRPFIILNVCVTIFAFFLSDQVIPVTNAKFAALLWSVREQRPEMIVKEGVFSNEIDGYSIKVNKRSNDSDILYGIMIYDHTEEKGNISVAIADSGYLNMSDDKQFMILTLFSGESYADIKSGARDNKKVYPFRREKFDKEELIINVKDYNLKRTDESFFKSGYKMLKNAQLKKIVDSLDIEYIEHEQIAATSINYNNFLDKSINERFKPDSLNAIPKKEEKLVLVNFDSIYSSLSKQNKSLVLETAQRNAQTNQRNILQSDADLNNRIKWINRHLIEWHRKFTLSLACIIFFFIGAPLGAIIRKGGFGTPVVVSVLLFISYYLISMIGENYAREGVWSTAFSMWYSTFFFLIVGIFLTHQAVTDSMLLNSEAYGRLFRRLGFLKSFFHAKEDTEQNENTLLNE